MAPGKLRDQRGQGSRGTGRGPGRQGGRGDGRTGPGGSCLCPKCGYKEVHLRGVPCTQVRCAQCGHVMLREQTPT